MVVPYREEMAKRHLKVTGDLGRVVFVVRISVCYLSKHRPAKTSSRSTISETPSRSRQASGTPMSSTTWLAGTTLRSKRYPRRMAPVCPANRWIRNFSLEDVHIEGAERIAEAVAKYDVDRFIHVSS